MASVVEKQTQRADEIAATLAALPNVEGVCLFGSVARGDPDGWSDIDLLVVGDEEVRPTLLLRELPARLRDARLSLVCYSAGELRELFESGSSFVHHIRKDGRVLHDRTGLLTQIFSDSFEARVDVRTEVAAELERLEIYDDLSLFKDNFLFCLAQLYAIGKAVVILGVLAAGEPEYSRERAFAVFRRRYSSSGRDLDVIERLRPFYRLVTRRRTEPLPFAYRGAGAEVTRAVAAIRSLASGIA